jgi:hypothetical protein
MTDVLATEAHVDAHPKALVTLQRRARDMAQFTEMLSAYLKARTTAASDAAAPERDGE